MIPLYIRQKQFPIFLILSFCLIGKKSATSSPDACNFQTDLFLNHIKVDVFANSNAKLSVEVLNSTSTGEISASLNFSASSLINATSIVSAMPNTTIFTFDSLSFGEYTLKVTNSSDEVVDCSFTVSNLTIAQCGNTSTDTTVTIFWTDPNFDLLEISSTQPETTSSTNSNSSFTLVDLNSGHGYEVNFLLNSTENGVETIIHSQLNCITVAESCNFLGNVYVQSISLFDEMPEDNAVEVAVKFNATNCADNCSWSINSTFYNESQVAVVDPAVGIELTVYNTSATSDRLLFVCFLSWDAPGFECSGQTETSFNAKMSFSSPVESLNATLANNVGTVILNENKTEGNVSFSSLIPGTLYNFTVDHEKTTNKIQFIDQHSCGTIAMMPPENFTFVYINTDSATVSWDYATRGEAQHFNLTLQCTAPDFCSNNDIEMTFNRSSGTQSFSEVIQNLQPASSYRLRLEAVINDETATATPLTIHTKPSDVTIDESSFCNSSVTSIKLTWTHNESNHTGIQYNVTSTSQTTDLTTDIDEINITSLEPDKFYNFFITAIWQGRESRSTNVTCQTNPVPKPISFSFTQQSKTDIQLQWALNANVSEAVSYELTCSSVDSTCPHSFPNTTASNSVNITDFIPGKVYNVSVNSKMDNFTSEISSINIRTIPDGCNINNLLDSVTLNIFENKKVNSSFRINSTTLHSEMFLWLESDSGRINSTSTVSSTNNLEDFNFEDLDFGQLVLNIANETEENIVLSCLLNVSEPLRPQCSAETETGFSISWTEEIRNPNGVITSTEPEISNISTTTNQSSFTSLEAGHGYTVAIQRDIGQNGVKMLVYEEVLHCITLRKHCNFTGNMYVNKFSLTNLNTSQVEIQVSLDDDNCDNCKIDISSLDGSNFNNQNSSTWRVPNTNGLHFNITSTTLSNKELFGCTLSSDILNWNFTQTCPKVTETTVSAKLQLTHSFQSIGVIVSETNLTGTLETESEKAATANFTDLDPDTVYTFVSTHETDSDGIFYVDTFSCSTDDVLPVSSFTQIDQGTDFVRVSWNYYSDGEADNFHMTWRCDQPKSACASADSDNQTTIQNDRSQTTHTFDISGLNPAITYEVNLTSLIKEFSSSIKTLTVNTKPTNVTFVSCEKSPTTIVVSWTHAENDNEGMSYNISENLTHKFEVVTAPTTSKLFDDLHPDKTYMFSIFAERESIIGNTTSFSCSTDPVPEIEGLEIDEKNQTTVKLDWTYDENMTETIKFEVYCEDSGHCPRGQLLASQNDSYIWIDSLLPGEEFTFVVRAVVNTFLSSNATIVVRTSLYPPALSNLVTSISNEIELPVFDCDQKQRVEAVSVLWMKKTENQQCLSSGDWSLSQNFTVVAAEQLCNNSNFKFNPINTSEGVNFGDVVCLKLILKSGNETTESIREVRLYPDSISDLECQRSDITTTSVKISWTQGQGSVAEYNITWSDTSSQTTTDEFFTFHNLSHGSFLEFNVTSVATNGLHSKKSNVSCRVKVKVPTFTAVDDDRRIKIDTEVDLNNDIQNFVLTVYNKSKENNCGVTFETPLINKTFYENLDDYFLSKNEMILPGGIYCIEITTSTSNPQAEEASGIKKVALQPEVPLITTNVTSSTEAVVSISNYDDVIFKQLEYKLNETTWDQDNGNWTSQSLREVKISDSVEFQLQNLPRGTVLTMEVKWITFANLSQSNQMNFQTKPDTPSIIAIKATNTSCTFTISASRRVTHFQEESGDPKTVAKAHYDDETVSMNFTFSDLKAHTNSTYNFSALSKYGGFESHSDAVSATCETKHGPPSKVRNLTIDVSDESAGLYRVSWLEPAHPNGPLVGYKITYERTRSKLQSSIEPDKFSSSTNIDDVFIPQGYTLKVTVFAFNDVDGISESESTTRPVTSKPSVNDKYSNSNQFSSKKSKSTVIVDIPCDLFNNPGVLDDADSNESPPIAFTRIIAATGAIESEDLPSHNELVTKTSNDEVYYASGEMNPTGCNDNQRSRRSTESGTWTFTVGNGTYEDCGNKICNPSLKAGKRYSIFIRAFANDQKYEDVKLGEYKTSDPDKPILLIVLLIVACAVLIVVIGLVVAAVLRRYEPCSSGPKPAPRKGDIRRDSVDVSRWSKPIPIERFREEYETLSLADGFKREFAEFTRAIIELDLPQRQALNPFLNGQNEGTPKNRWGDILPYDRRLVPLQDGYINASYISGERSEREYIATQGPMSHTEGDFWQMIWEQNVMQIVMLCQAVEIRQGQPKQTCHEYWPMNKDTTLKGNVMTALVNSDDAGDLWTRRVIKIQMRGMNPAREVIQYHFRKWDDRSSAIWKELEPLIRLVDQEKVSSPIVVHCSAGVGRTGTYIMLHRMLLQTQYSSTFDIRGMVAEMRTMRPCMVQTVAQYKFIHDVGLILSEKMNQNGMWSPQPIASPRSGAYNRGFTPGEETGPVELNSLNPEHKEQENVAETSLIDLGGNGQVNPLFEGDEPHLV